MTTLADKLGALHVWPQHVADHYADILTPKEIEKLYEIGSVADKALRALRERDQAVEALKTTNAWLDRWARHIGNCPGIDDCTCGLTRVRYEAITALASIEGTGHE